MWPWWTSRLRLILSLTIHNASSMVTRLRIDGSGIPGDWYDLDQPRAALL